MHRQWIAILALLGAAGAQAAQPATSPTSATRSPEPIVTRQTGFAIPFQMGRGASESSEVYLLVSIDRGATWQSAGKATLKAGNFSFRAPRDGEYWFAIAKSPPPTNQAIAYKPELNVIVDTAPPRLELVAQRGESGEINARWQAVDPNLNPESLKIEYQPGPNQPWEPLAIDARQDAAQPTLAGEGVWWPKATDAELMIRAKISDRAGNPAVMQVKLAAGRGVASAVPTTNGAAGMPDKPIVVPGQPGYEFAARAGEEPAEAESPVDKQPPAAPPLTAHAPVNDEASAPPIASRAWPPDRAAGDPFMRRPWPDMQPPSDPPPSEPSWRQAGTAQAPVAKNDLPVVTYPAGHVPARQVSNQAASLQTPPLDLSMIPPGQRPRWVGATQFEIDYEVDGVGSTGIARVEVWGTRDGGRTWSTFAADDDNRSPVAVKVDGEGVYGLAIVFVAGNGFGGEAPRQGDKPELWIAVDLARPVVAITGVEAGREAGDLLVRWEASDGQLEPRPISLFYSERAGGPWTPVVAALENVGSFTWRTDSRLPERMYLRLEARDEAGNVGAFETSQPVALERQRPQGRILGVRPLGPPQAGPSR